MNAREFMEAAHVPEKLKPQVFGLWKIKRASAEDLDPLQAQCFRTIIGFDSMTMLSRISMKTLHLQEGEIVMEDSITELRRHLPIWMHAKGNVLVTGLGLGCVVRGLKENPDVDQITVIEIDHHILRIIGHEFRGCRRVRLIHGDALKYQFKNEKFDYAWHDIWTDGDRHLQLLHSELIRKYRKIATIQGAWNFPRSVKRRMPEWFLR
jgi:spermidine synthase